MTEVRNIQGTVLLMSALSLSATSFSIGLVIGMALD
jgi:hypothetical protein